MRSGGLSGGHIMLHLAHKIAGATVRGTNGEIGSLEDFYFEEDRWTVRYLLVDTGKWFRGKRVLISPMSVRNGWGRTGVRLSLTKDQVWNSPEFNEGEPFSRTSESHVLAYYGYPDYWGAASVWGNYDSPIALVEGVPAEPVPTPPQSGIDPEARHLRSIKKSTGYHLHARNGEIGHVDDFLIGQESWRIRYLLVDTSNWIGGRSVIVSPETVEGIDKERGELYVAVDRDAIEKAPELESIQSALDLTETGPPFTII
jgi:hypothetical protein